MSRKLSGHGAGKRGVPERGARLEEVSLHQGVETRVQSHPQPAVPVRQRGVIQVLSTEDSLGEVDGGALVSAVALQRLHQQEVSAHDLSK